VVRATPKNAGEGRQQSFSPTTHHLDPSPQNHHSYPNCQYFQFSNNLSTVVFYSASIPIANVSSAHPKKLFLLPVLQSNQTHHQLDLFLFRLSMIVRSSRLHKMMLGIRLLFHDMIQ
jgi:hypothetical protein